MKRAVVDVDVSELDPETAEMVLELRHFYRPENESYSIHGGAR